MSAGRYLCSGLRVFLPSACCVPSMLSRLLSQVSVLFQEKHCCHCLTFTIRERLLIFTVIELRFLQYINQDLNLSLQCRLWTVAQTH